MGSTKKLTSIVSGAILAANLVAPGMARAADLLMDPPVTEAPEVVTHQAGGWYLRGDITYDFHEMEGANYTAGDYSASFLNASIDDSWDIGLGIGYQINENFRVDLTGEYVFKTSFGGNTQGYCDAAALAADELNCWSEDSSSFTAFKLLANAYVDLGNFNGFTPYVGAGLGGARVNWDGLTSDTTCTQYTGGVDCPYDPPTSYVGDATSSTTSSQHGGVESWRFAWALHAGFSYDVTHNTKLDIGYTYSRIEGGDMFKFIGGDGTQGFDEGIDSHVVRAGIRYQIW